MTSNSFFDGGLFSNIVYTLLAIFITLLTFGLGLPWAICILERWKASHTVIDGRRLYFDGNGIQLFGNYIKWFLLTLITFGIYGFWLHIKMKQWVVSHTHFSN